MVILTHESYDNVLVGTGKQKSIKELEWVHRHTERHGRQVEHFRNAVSYARRFQWSIRRIDKHPLSISQVRKSGWSEVLRQRGGRLETVPDRRRTDVFRVDDEANKHQDEGEQRRDEDLDGCDDFASLLQQPVFPEQKHELCRVRYCHDERADRGYDLSSQL